MPTITLTFKPPYSPSDTTPYIVQKDDLSFEPASWIVLVDWRTAVSEGKEPLAKDQGVYIIEKAGVPIYAGQAINVRQRFIGRGSVFHDFALKTVAIQDMVVRVAKVSISPARAKGILDLPEHWIVRVLVKRDQKLGTDTCQNRKLRTAFPAPSDGLDLWIKNDNAPAYLINTTLQGYKKRQFQNERYDTYAYDEGELILE